MHNRINSLINGQIIKISLLSICTKENQMNIEMSLKTDNSCVSISFSNVSSLQIRGLAYPSQISGFEIISNKDKGWDKSQRYTINDYEDGKIKFFCEDISLDI